MCACVWMSDRFDQFHNHINYGPSIHRSQPKSRQPVFRAVSSLCPTYWEYWVRSFLVRGKISAAKHVLNTLSPTYALIWHSPCSVSSVLVDFVVEFTLRGLVFARSKDYLVLTSCAFCNLLVPQAIPSLIAVVCQLIGGFSWLFSDLRYSKLLSQSSPLS